MLLDHFFTCLKSSLFFAPIILKKIVVFSRGDRFLTYDYFFLASFPLRNKKTDLIVIVLLALGGYHLLLDG